MPFRSDAQRRFMFAKHPEIAKEFQAATPKNANLPEHVKKADGGLIDPSMEPGAYGDTDPGHFKAIIDSLGSGMGVGGLGAGLATSLPEIAKGLGEAGEITIGKAAPKMEEDISSVAPKVEAYIKGIQKGYKGSPDVKIWGVKGDPQEIAKLGFGEDPGSIPEHILRQKGILPESIDMTAKEAPNEYADGGVVARLKKYFGGDKSDAQKADDIDPVVTSSSSTPKGYDDGGAVTPDDSDWKDKLAAVYQAMGMGAKAAVAPLMPSPAAPTTPIPAAANPTGTVQAPMIPQPPAPAPMPAQAQPPVNPAPAPAPVPSGNTNSAPTQKPSASDLLDKLTDGDGAKMQALLANLKDQDKRSQFAQALGVIGDTFGNMGMAKAGMRPEGFTTPQMLQGMNEKSKAAQIENLTQSLAADPNSQTSHMAQQTLMQAMGIKPGDPREASIRRLPAQAITSMMPQMQESIKNSLEREKNLITAKKADTEAGLKGKELTLKGEEIEKGQKQATTQAAVDLLKNTSVFNRPAQNLAENALQQNIGGPAQGQAMTATNKMGHKIVSHDGGKTWQPLQ